MAKDNSGSENFHYNNIEKKDKNFMYKNFKRSNCYNCNFSNSNFNFATFRGAHFKTCSFMNGTFEGTEFIGTNLKNSKFKNAKFKNAIFEGANLYGTDFKDAKFENTIFLGCKLEKTKNFSTELQGIRIFEEMPEINISSELEEALSRLMENKYVKASRIFDTKDGNINTLTLMILKENFNEEELIKGFNEIKSQIDRDFYTISYIIRLINKVIA
ncbi:MAG: pentapeptide repeat-containing protein [Clostridium sp.]|uniref:pentapeptide repeat-containing protein n=1 Tax=Clostridium sp. TaxID=1506 RepID=UPI0025C6F720|nr:pentapeptide repeat-containing protein [Clostridium sp.]MBS4955703.1 pentapeptide repeat-containing protein [Clostridium sp.]